jgi:hypothetical protein
MAWKKLFFYVHILSENERLMMAGPIFMPNTSIIENELLCFASLTFSFSRNRKPCYVSVAVLDIFVLLIVQTSNGLWQLEYSSINTHFLACWHVMSVGDVRPLVEDSWVGKGEMAPSGNMNSLLHTRYTECPYTKHLIKGWHLMLKFFNCFYSYAVGIAYKITCKCVQSTIECVPFLGSDVDSYVIIGKLLDFIFNVLWERKSPFGESRWTVGLFVCKVACSRYNVPLEMFQIRYSKVKQGCREMSFI